MAKARLETVLTGDDSPFVQAVNRAEKRAETFHSRLQRLFQRTPEARAERALSGFLGDLTSGNVSGAITGLSSKISGFGLAAGVGIGVAIETFIKAKAQIDEVNKSVDKLNTDLSRPLSLQGALGPEGISKEIETTKKDLDDLREKRKGIFQQISEAGQKGQPDFFNTATLKVEVPNRVPAAQLAQENAEKRLRQLINARADSELEIVNVKRVGLTQSEQEGDLFKLRLDSQKEIARLGLDEGLNKPGRDQAVLFKRIAAVSAAEKLATDEINRRYSLKQNEVDLESRLIDIKSSGLTKEQQSVAAAKEKVKALQQQLALAQTTEQKSIAGVRLKGAQAELRETQFGEADQSSNAVAARNAAQLGALKRQAFNTFMDQAANGGASGKAYGATVNGIGNVGQPGAAYGQVALGDINALSNPNAFKGPGGGPHDFSAFDQAFGPKSVPDTEGNNAMPETDSGGKGITKEDMSDLFERYLGGN